jgi:hypothetical protein
LYSEMTTLLVGMNPQCLSIRGTKTPGERCPCKPLAGGEWCGKHKGTQIRFVAAPSVPASPPPADKRGAALKIFQTWRRWLARRAGPVLWFREESNNHADFFSGDLITDIPIKEVVSFVEAGKGYIMDIKSAVALLEHSAEAKEPALNPFNRAPLSALFLKRVALHKSKAWAPLKAMTESQIFSMGVTDVFRGIEDLGYYTDPSWFIDLNRVGLQRLYIEMADIWYHRASLTAADRHRIVPTGKPIGIPISTALVMNLKALRHHVLNACKMLTSAAPARSDRQLGIMYVLGALSLVSAGASTAYPWLLEMFSPGITRIIGTELAVLHPSVLAY